MSRTEMSRTECTAVDLYMTFVDCPPRFVVIVRQCHNDMQARVQNDGPFVVTNGTKQGCVMSPTLFSMMFSAMLMDDFQDSDSGFPIK